MDFNLILVDPKKSLIDAWKERFNVYPKVSYHHGKFEEIEEYDCIINAGNGFGLMDGGVDYAISEYFGWHLQKDIQEIILDVFYGEQPVGTSFVCDTGNNDHPYIAHTPTMRAPSNIRGTDNVYNAFRAALMEITTWNIMAGMDSPYDPADGLGGPLLIGTVVCMGLGTSCGGVDVNECARQMHLAYKNVAFPPTKINWSMAKQRHIEIDTSPRGNLLDMLASGEV